MATQLPIVRSRFEHRVLTPPPEQRRNAWGGISMRPAAVIAGLAVAAALIGGLIWPAQLASKKAIAVVTASVSAGEVATPDPTAAQAEVRNSAIDAPPAPEPGSGSMPASENTPRENTSSELATDISAASTAGLRLSSAAVDEPAAASEVFKTAELKTAEPTAAPPVASDVVATREPALGETPKDDDGVARDALFREYLHWRAARVSAVPPPARQTAAKSHHHVRSAAATPAATDPQGGLAQPSSAAQATPVPRPRRPRLSSTQTHAPD
jgi:hypothetical protein